MKRADDAGKDFEQRTGFDCGLTLDDMGQISVATDAMHDAMRPAFDLELMRLGANTITVPRVNHARAVETDRQLPKITWQAWKAAFNAAYKLYGPAEQAEFPSHYFETCRPRCVACFVAV